MFCWPWSGKNNNDFNYNHKWDIVPPAWTLNAAEKSGRLRRNAVADVAAVCSRWLCYCNRCVVEFSPIYSMGSSWIRNYIAIWGRRLKWSGDCRFDCWGCCGRSKERSYNGRVDAKYFRSTEVETLLGSPQKAEQKLGWIPKITAQQMCAEMVASDLRDAKKRSLLQLSGMRQPYLKNK